MVKMFSIHDVFTCSILSLLFVSSPFICTLLGYNFVSGSYAFSFFLSVLSAFFLCSYKKFFLGVLFAVLSLSIYQAFLAITLTLVLMSYMKELLEAPDITWRAFFFKGMRYVAFFSLSLIIYLIAVKISVYITDKKLVPHQSIDKMASENLFLYIKGLGKAYVEFFNPKTSFPFHTKILYETSLFILGFILIIKGINIKNKTKLCSLAFLCILFPPCVNCIYIMCPHEIYTLAIWIGALMLYVFIFFLLEKDFFFNRIKSFVKFLVLLMIIVFVRLDNMAYFQANFMQTQAIGYFTTLVSRIQNTEGYAEKYPVVFLNEFNKHSASFDFDLPILPYYGVNWLLNNYAWKTFVANWLAYRPTLAKIEDFEGLPEVKAMPHYPDYGSIKVINKTVVVNF